MTHASPVSSSKLPAYIEGWLSVALNTALFLAKYGVGTASGSVAVVADAWHTLSDSLTSLVLLAGFWIAGRRADREHPFGHGRAEAIGSIVICSLLAVVGIGFLKESAARLWQMRAARFGAAAVGILLASTVLKEALARYSIFAGRRLKSSSLIADGWHHRSDAIASGLIAAGALLGGRIWWLDGAMGIGVSLLILWVAFDLLMHTASALLGEAPSAEFKAHIRSLIGQAVPAASRIHHLHLHRYGDHSELTLHLRLPGDMDLRGAHEIASRAEEAIRRQTGIEATIHAEPEPGPPEASPPA